MRARLLHGFLETCLLSLLEEEPDYGLSLGQRLSAAGLDDVPGGTLYPALVRLERQGLVTVTRVPSESGPPRKYFELNDRGRAQLAERRAEWTSFSAILSEVMGTSGTVR